MMNDIGSQPILSLIISMFGVERFLPAFLASVERQRGALAHAELIFVDDGSPDRSSSLVEEWLERTGIAGRLIRQMNTGLSGARNRGLAAARGRWVSFPDPDDILDDEYLSTLLRCLPAAESQGASAVAANIIYLDEPALTPRDSHPLRSMFRGGIRLIDLEREPQEVKIQAASTFFRLAHIQASRLEFDPRIRPNFEDGAYMCRYLAADSHPTLLAVPEARYLYRQRADNGSLVSSSWTKAEKYTDLPRFGWLQTLADLSVDGHVPEWMQHIILYDMSWYFRLDGQIHSPTRSIPEGVKREFVALLREVLAYISPESIMSYHLTGMSRQVRMSLIALRGDALPLAPLHLWRVDWVKRLVLIKYYYSGELPEERFWLGSRPIQPTWSKSRRIDYFGETFMHERILWLPVGDSLRAHLAGERVELRYRAPGPHHWAATTREIHRHFGNGGIAGAPAMVLEKPRQSAGRRMAGRVRSEWVRRKPQLTRAVTGRSLWIRRPWASLTKYRAATGRGREEFRDAWVFMDRDTQAQDNAEHLYRWVAQHRPAVNAWFVLRRTSSDWARLHAEGFRLLEFGSTRHMMALRNASNLISSHIDHYVVVPWDTRLFGRGKWRFTFLQHGVTKDDISRWLNPKPISLIVTTSEAEQQGFVGDDTPYVLTEREARLTGFPRHDALLAKAQALAPEERDMILVVPTWREYLMKPRTGTGNHRDLIEGFEESEYARAWHDLLADPALTEYAHGHGLRLGFLPHPNLEEHVSALALPPGVEVFTYATSDVQDVLARARLLVTDYSSIAFESAYIGTPLVYFQFDQAEFFARHPHRPGYFSYEDDGFGPVTSDSPDAAARIIEMLEAGSDASHEYARRAETFFPERDGRNCERTHAAIVRLWSPELVG